ncbi:UNVERIFIED_CONTAM: hypothetical protein Slati_2754600 [Sesamum latifolium]|uniref:Reverse transcriptase Ty1/copia-type domain-containing protein n=1 Tax=Sesamum latifolium TaxID=2727402 RepID=A0AAW2VXY3_9LAMI
MAKFIWILLAVTAWCDYEIWQMDVKTIFLNSFVEEEIYRDQPEGFTSVVEEQKVCRLQRSIYGLKQASQSWNTYFDEVIRGYDFIKNEFGPYAYKKISGSSIAYLALYVDDILLIGNDVKMLETLKHGFSLNYLKRTKDMFLIYDDGELIPKGYSDTSFQSEDDDANSKQSTTVDSTTAAEYIAAKEAVWMKNYIQELDVVPSINEPVVIFCDNNGAIGQEKKPRSHHHSKLTFRRYHLLREIESRGDVRMDRVSAAKNTADPLTKPISQIARTQHVDKMDLRSMGDSF